MSRRTRWLAAALIAVVAVAVAWMGARSVIERVVRHRVEAALAASTEQPAALNGVELALLPPRIRAATLVVGTPSAPALRATGIDCQLDVGRSLSSGRPVLRAAISALQFDARRWPERQAPSGGAAAALVAPVWLPGGVLEIGEVRMAVRLRDQALDAETRGLHLEVSPGSLGVGLAVTGGAISFSSGTQSVQVTEWRIEGDARAEGPRLRVLQLHSDFLTIEASATSSATVALQAEADLHRLWGVIEAGGSAGGRLHLQGTVGADLNHPNLQATIVLDAPAYDTWRAERAQGTLLFDGRTATLREATAEFSGLTVGADGYVAIEPPHGFGVWLRLPQTDVASLAERMALPVMRGSAEATVEMSGALQPLSADGYATASVGELRTAEGETKGLDAALEGRVELAHGTTALEAQARLGAGGTLGASARVGAGQELSGHVSLSLPDAGVLRPLVAELRGGSATLHGALAGTVAEPTLAGDIDARGLVLAGSRIDAVTGAFTATHTRLTASGVQVDAVGGRTRVDGDFAMTSDERNDWRAELRDVDLETAWLMAHSAGIDVPYVGGKLSGSVSVSGLWSAPRLEARLAAAPLTVVTERLASAALEAHADGTSWRGTLDLRRGADESLAIEANGTGRERLALSLHSSPWSLARFHSLPAAAAPVAGTIAASATVSGSFASPQGEAEMVLRSATVRGYDIGEITARATSQPGAWLVRVSAPNADVTAEATIRTAAGLPFQLSSTLRQAQLTTGPEAQPLQLTVGGTVTAAGLLTNPVPSLTARLAVQEFEVKRGEHRWSAVRPIVVQGERGRFHIESAAIEGDLGGVDASGSFALDGTADLDLVADTDAAILELLGPPFTSARGAINVRAHVVHSAAQAWDLRGRGRLDGIALDIGLPFAFTDVSGGFDLTHSEIVLDGLHGRAGGGEFSLTGVADVASGPRLHFVAQEISSGFLDWLDDRVSGTGAIEGTWDAVTISGDIDVLNALYDRPIEMTQMLPWFRERVAPKVHPPSEKAVGLDLRIHADDSVYVDTNYAKAELRGDLHVTGTDIKPLLQGRVEVLAGEVVFHDRRFTVSDGEVGFTGASEINPTLNLTASTSVTTPDSEYLVTAQVIGTLRDYRVLLTADDPSMTTNDVVTLIATGRTPTQLQREGGGSVSLGGAVELAPSLYGRTLQEGVTRYVPLDRFEVEPVYSRSTGSIEPRLTIGKELTDGLRALASSTFGVEAKNTVSLEYRLTPGILLETSWESETDNQAGGFGADIKFRHEFRRLPSLSLWPSRDGEKR